ncbi:hypothetical protein R1sor_001116 [Riccia sorocarpa]|uniref:Uncharacterized protein n=1 Tax=Riccia sorocarpa TaxID=122646 RepID=A0ABD3GZ08_9MARC
MLPLQFLGRRRVNTWIKLQKRMIVSCRNFTKTAKAYKKKYLGEFKKYREDKLYNDKSGNDIKVTCRFYDELDKESGNSLHVKKVIHADAAGSDNPCPVEDDSFLEKSLDTTENRETIECSSSKVTSGVEGPGAKSPPKEKPTTMKQDQDRICSILENLVGAVTEIGNKIEKNASRLNSYATSTQFKGDI